MNKIDNNTILLGKILGEIYRLQRQSNISTVHEATIYALLNGFENVIKEQLERVGFISQDQLTKVISVLEPIWRDKQKLASFKGYYDIEHELEAKGIDRVTAITVLTYLNANGQFTDVISKMDSSDSPSECRTFKLREWDL